MQFQVPQFIDAEDKIVGPFSLRQFAIVGAAGVICAMLYFVLITWIWAIISIVIFGFALALAFIKIEGRSFLNIILSAFNFYWKPQTYVWQPEHQVATHPQAVHESAGASALKDIVKKSTVAAKPLSRQTVATGSALHQSWENVQTGASKKSSDKEFLERQMEQRYQIFQKTTGERNAAKRVDYR